MLDFYGEGNLGDTPTLKMIKTAKGDIAKAEMNVRFERRVSDGKGGFVDKGSFWAKVETWNYSAENCARVLRKGMRVSVKGTPSEESWADKKNPENTKPITQMCISADSISLCLGRIETVVMKEKVRRDDLNQNAPDLGPDVPLDHYANESEREEGANYLVPEHY